MKRKHIHPFSALLLSASVVFVCGALCTSCQDEIDKSAIYTLTGQTVADVLKDDPDFSDYYELTQRVTPTKCSKSPVSQLVSTRGHYTCFAPTNEAMKEYLDELYAGGIIRQEVSKAYEIEDEHLRDSIMKVIVLNSIIDSGDNNLPYTTFDFLNGSTLPLANMNNRLLRTDITAEDGQTVYLLCRTCPVIQRDIEAINGYVQKMGKVVAPNNSNVSDLMHTTANMTIFNRLLKQTGFDKTLEQTRDEEYEELYQNNTFGVPHLGIFPEHRDIGFTLFVEPDDVYRQNGITNAEELIAYLIENDYYGAVGYDRRTEAEGGDYRNSNHIVNQFVVYHILPFAAPYDRLTLHCNEWMWSYLLKQVTVPVYEYYTTLNTNPRRMIKLTESQYTGGIRLNRYTEMLATANEYDEIVNGNTVPGILVESTNGDLENEAVNGYIYPIGEMLVYDESLMKNKVLNERIRFDATALCPELMTNKIRGIQGYLPGSLYRSFPKNYSYFSDNLTWSEDTKMSFANGWLTSYYRNYKGDELIGKGHYDVTIKLPPVPYDGTYELRYYVTAMVVRGLAQIYFGEKGSINAMGIPLDMRMGGRTSTADASIISPAGWEADSEDDQDYNDLVDKRMRNNGYMKAPNYWGSPGNPVDHTRNWHTNLRHILLRRHFERDKTYYLRIKSVLESEEQQLFLDCLELVPSNVYNNPEKKEDIW